MGFSSSQILNMKIFVAIAFFVAVAECRRHLCDDGTRPVCPDGSKAVYNRPTGKNTGGSKYFPPPVCSGEGAPACADGSEAKVRFNTCAPDGKKCHHQCKSGVPHCPWFTKNRNKHDGIRVYNTGDNRPGNKGHNWGPAYDGNKP